MDRLDKALQKLGREERGKIKEVLERIATGRLEHLDHKKLKGRRDVFRVRKGDVRIIFRTEGDRVFILAIERRGKDTYKEL